MGYNDLYYIFGAFAGLFTFFFLIVIALYIVYSIGLMKLAEGLGKENPWFAFIPILNAYLLGDIVEYVEISGTRIDNLKLIYPGGAIAVFVLGGIPLIGWILNIAFIGLSILVMYKLFAMYKPNSALIYTILSFVVIFALPILVFSIRNLKPVQRRYVDI